MKLPELLPPNDLLKNVEGVESGLHQRQRLGIFGVVLAVLQIVVLIVNNDWLQGLTTTNWMVLISERWELLLIVIGLVASVVLASWSKFWLEESKAPFRYTYSIADFKAVGDVKEERLSVQLSHDLAQRLNVRIKRLSLLDEEEEKKQKPDSDKKHKSHIHIKGFYLIRRNPEGLWFVEIMPRVRIGPSGSAETLAHVVRFRLPDDPLLTKDSAQDNAAKADEASPPQLTARNYEQILERVYFSVATEIYKQIQQDVKRKIELLPTNYYRAVALFHEAEDYAASNTLDAYKEALNLYDESIKAFDPSMRPPLKEKVPRFVQKSFQKSNKLWARLRFSLNHFLPRFGKVQLLCARAEIGYASMLYYRRTLASILAQKTNAPFEIRPAALSARNRLLHVSPDLPGRNDSLFDANVTLCLAWYSLGVLGKAKECLDEALRSNPARTEIDPKYLFASACLKTNSDEVLQLYQQAVELEPRFDVAQFSRAISMEMDWRRKSVLERNVAELVFREYDELLRTNPGNVGAWSNTGYMRWLLDDADKAREAFEVGREYKDIKRETFVAELDYGLARVAAEAGDFSMAYQYFDSGLSALIARGVAHSLRGNTAEFYHYDLINKTIIDRFERYRDKLKKNLKFWDDFDNEYGSFQELISAAQDSSRRNTAINVLAELLLLVGKRTTALNRRALADWAERQTNPKIKSGLKDGDLATFAAEIRSAFASSWDADFYRQLQQSLDDPAFANLIDRHAPKKRVRDAVHAFVLEDYGNACHAYFLRTGDSDYQGKAKDAYLEAIGLKEDFVLPYYRVYTRINLGDKGLSDKYISKVLALAESWPDGKLERIKTEIEDFWRNREEVESAAKTKLERANEYEARAQSLSEQAVEALSNAQHKRREANNLSDDYVESTLTERAAERLPDIAPANFNKQVNLRMTRQVGASDLSVSEAGVDATSDGNDKATPAESRRQILRREAEELEQAAIAHTEEAKRLQEEANKWIAEADEGLIKASGMEVPEDKLIAGYLKDFLPHRWLWTSSKGQKSTFNFKALKRNDYVAERKWEREFNSLQVTALLVWAQSRKTKEAVQLFDHLRDHFWPEDFELIRARRRLLKELDPEKDNNEEKLRAQVQSWLQYSPYMVISYWIGEVFTGDKKAAAYLEAASQIGFSKQCYEYLGSELVNLNQNEAALEAFRKCRPSEPAALLALGDALTSKEPQLAVGAYLKASDDPKLFSGDPELLLTLGNRLYDYGKPREAIQVYRRLMDTCDPQRLRSLGSALEERRLWVDSLRAYRRAQACDTSDNGHGDVNQLSYHLLIGRNLLALAKQNAERELAAIGNIPDLTKTPWRKKIVEDSLSHITSTESYRLLRAWLEDQQTQCEKNGDVQGHRDATEAILRLSHQKYFRLNPKRSSLPSLIWSTDIVDVEIQCDAAVFATGAEQDTSQLEGHLDEVRLRIEQEMGVPIGPMRITLSSYDYLKNSYIVSVQEVPTVMGTVQPGQTFFPRYKEIFADAEFGAGAFNPQTGEMDGVWLDPSLVASLQNRLHPGWSQFEYAAHHIEAVLRTYLTSLLGLEQVLKRISNWLSDGCENGDGWRNKLVAKTLPDNSSKLRFTQLLQALVWEGVPTTDLQAILEAFNNSKGLDLILSVEVVRLAIKDQLPGNSASFQFLCLSEAFENEIKRWIWNYDGRVFFAIEPEETQALLNAVRTAVGDRQHSSLVIVSRSPGIRPFVRRLIELQFPRITFLSLEELRRDLQEQLLDTVEYKP